MRTTMADESEREMYAILPADWSAGQQSAMLQLDGLLTAARREEEGDRKRRSLSSSPSPASSSASSSTNNLLQQIQTVAAREAPAELGPLKGGAGPARGPPAAGLTGNKCGKCQNHEVEISKKGELEGPVV